MKKVVSILFASYIAANAGFLDQVSGLMGQGESKEQTKSVTTQNNGLLSSITSATGLTTNQATGTVGALMGYAKNNLSGGEYSNIMDKVPGLSALAGGASGGGIGSMLSSKLTSTDAVNSSLSALGVEPSMVKTIIPIVVQYVGQYAGVGSSNLLSNSLSGLLK